jgi:hypothetical protein
VLKSLAILALAFNILPVQTYAQPDKAQHTPKTDKPSATVARVAPQDADSPALQAESKNHINADVRIVSTPEKDGWDKTAFWVNAALAFAGIVGVTIGVCTLWLIRAQVAEMRKQADLMAGQLEEMKKAREIENKTLILQYRPKVIVRNVRALEFSSALYRPGECQIRFTIVNVGGSPAHIVSGGNLKLISALGYTVDNVALHDGDEFVIPEFTLEPGQQNIFDGRLTTGTDNDEGWIAYRKGRSTSPSRYLYLMGTIWYQDDLNIPRATGVSRKYDISTKTFAPMKESEEEYTD